MAGSDLSIFSDGQDLQVTDLRSFEVRTDKVITACVGLRYHTTKLRRPCPPNLFCRRRACWMRPAISDSGGLRGADVFGHDKHLFLRARLSDLRREARRPCGR